MNNPTWSVYTVEALQDDDYNVGRYNIVKTVWNQGGPTSLRKVVGTLNDVTAAQALEHANEAQRIYDGLRQAMA